MTQKTATRYEDLSKAQLKRLATILVARSLIVAVLLFLGYYLLPMNRPERSGLVVLIVGLVALGLVLLWQVRAIMGSPFPRLRAFETLTIGIPLLLIVFASAYYLIEQSDVNSFTVPLTKTDALYFTVTVFSTVGFGDITAKSELARVLVMIQMMFDLAVFGLVAKLIFGAVEVALRRRAPTPQADGPGPSAG
jgi:hypothetical protein